MRVVVEIDSPAHTQSWGRSEKYKSTIVKCDESYHGQFDPTNPLTYELLTSVMKYVNQTFEDPYLHFGGDEIDDECYDDYPSIKAWMKVHNISTYKQL